MNLITLKQEEFREYALKHPLNNFHQTIEWGLLKEKNGWEMILLGLTDKKEINAACMLLKKKTLIGNIFYSPRGFLIDYNNKELLKIFTDKIKKYGRDNKGIFIKIDPYVSYKERDINGKLVEGGFDNGNIVKSLIDLGYKHTGFNTYFENLQPRWIFTLNLEDKNIDDILSSMESKTRQLIRKNIRMKLVTRELKDDDLKEFKNVMNHTSERRGFVDRPFSYYKSMYEILSKNNMIKFMVTELDTNSYIDVLKDEIKEKEKNIKELNDKIENKAKINMDKSLSLIEKSKENIERINKKIDETKELKKKYGDIITLGGILFLTYGDEVLSLFGGSYKEFSYYYSPYTTNYEMIKYAIENKYKKYNFYGITGDFNETNEYYGLYDFKRGFGGQVVELIGEFDLIISKYKMTVYNTALKVYPFLKKIKLKKGNN